MDGSKHPLPKLINHNGVITSSPKQIADVINFTNLSIIKKLHRENPKVAQDPIEHYKKLMTNKNCQFQLRTITMSELRTMSKIKPTQSTGLDYISMKSIKEVFKSIEGAVLNLVNTSISTGWYPNNLKTSKAIPLLKQGKPPQDPQGYRLINLLPSLSKIIDKVVYKQVLEYLDTNTIIPHQHHGGRKGRSTITSISTMLDTWSTNHENGQDLAIIVLDQSAASPVTWQTDSSQYMWTDFNQTHSTLDNSPVVQGSELSCLLYLLYILDLPILFEDAPHWFYKGGQVGCSLYQPF